MSNQKHTTMKATVSGVTQFGEEFTTPVEFTLIPPAENEPHYGTGYYMTVKLPSDTKLIDVRYERTTDIEILADRFIRNYFGANAHEVTKEF